MTTLDRSSSSHEMSRRAFIGYLPIGASLVGSVLSSPLAAAGTPDPYFAMYAGNSILQSLHVANCGALTQEANKLRATATAINSNPTTYGQQYLDRAMAQRAALQTAVTEATNALSNAKIDDTIAKSSAALSLSLLALGAVLSGPIAVGTLAAVQILSGPTFLAWQVLSKTPSPNSEAVLMGYAPDRALMFGELAGAHASSTVGRFVGRVSGTTSLLLSAWQAWSSSADVATAKANLANVTTELKKLDQVFVVLGSNRTAWASAWKNVSEAAADALDRYVIANGSTNCIASVGVPVIKP